MAYAVLIGSVVTAGSAAYGAAQQQKAQKAAAANQRNMGAEIGDTLGISRDALKMQREQDYMSAFQQMDINRRNAQDAIRLYPQLADYERQATTAQRGQDVADLRRFGPGLQRTLEKLNPGWKQAGTALQDLLSSAGTRSPLLAQMNTDAMGAGRSQINEQLNNYALSQLALGDQIGADEQRQVTQDARAAASARGLFGGDAAALDEVMNLYGARQNRAAQRAQIAGGIQAGLLQEMVANRGFQQGVEGLNQSAEGAYRSFVLNAQGATQARLNPLLQMLTPRTALSPVSGAALLNGPRGDSAAMLSQLLGYGSDVNNTNYNAAQARAIAQANNAAAMAGAATQAGAQLLGGYAQSRQAAATDVIPSGGPVKGYTYNPTTGYVRN